MAEARNPPPFSNNFEDTPVFASFENLQFGVEFEFLAEPPPVPDEEAAEVINDLIPNDTSSFLRDTCWEIMATALQDSGLNSAWTSELMLSDMMNPLRDDSLVGTVFNTNEIYLNSGAIDSTPGTIKPYQVWMVKYESDIDKGLREDLRGYVPSELNTPILQQVEAERGFVTINKALDAIYASRYGHIHLTRSCGLHVHISAESGLKRRHVQRIASLLLVIDKFTLSRFAAYHRPTDNRTVEQQLDYIEGDDVLGLSPDQIRNTLSHADVREDIPQPLIVARPWHIARLWMHDEIGRLEEILSRYWFTYPNPSGLAFREHSAVGGPKSYSLEFRHAQSSFSRRFVGNWLTLVLAISKTAFLPPDEYRSMLERA